MRLNGLWLCKTEQVPSPYCNCDWWKAASEVEIWLKMAVCVLRPFWESEYPVVILIPPAPTCTLMLSQGWLFLWPWGKVALCVWSLCRPRGDAESVPPMLPKHHFASWRFGERLVLPCWLLHRCPRLPGSQKQNSPLNANMREEQSSRICPFTKANQSVVPSVLQLHETQWTLWKRQKICLESGEKMAVKIRCWEMVGAWITAEQTKSNKTKTWSRKYKKKPAALKWGEIQHSLGFSPASSLLPFHVCVHPLTFFLLGRQDPDWCWTVPKCCDTAALHPATPLSSTAPFSLTRHTEWLGVMLATPA